MIGLHNPCGQRFTSGKILNGLEGQRAEARIGRDNRILFTSKYKVDSIFRSVDRNNFDVRPRLFPGGFECSDGSNCHLVVMCKDTVDFWVLLDQGSHNRLTCSTTKVSGLFGNNLNARSCGGKFAVKATT